MQFLSDPEATRQRAGGNAVLAIGDNPDRRKPLLQPKGRVFKDGAHLRSELALSVCALALLFLLSLQPRHIIATASRAYNTLGPPMRHRVSNAIVGVREVNDGLLKGARAFHVLRIGVLYIDLGNIVITKITYPNGIQPIDVIFDDQGHAESKVLEWYSALRAIVQEPHRIMIANTPMFKDDRVFNPLQAADMLAWHIGRIHQFPYEDRSAIFVRINPDGIYQYDISREELQFTVEKFNKWSN